MVRSISAVEPLTDDPLSGLTFDLSETTYPQRRAEFILPDPDGLGRGSLISRRSSRGYGTCPTTLLFMVGG